jgi:hypothetical protein
VPGKVTNNLDCDDARSDRNPAQPELCGNVGRHR